MSNLRRIMQEELDRLDRRMEHLAAERGRIAEAIRILENVPPQVVGTEMSDLVHVN